MEKIQQKGEVEIIVKKTAVSPFNSTNPTKSLDVHTLTTHVFVSKTHVHYWLMKEDVEKDTVLSFCDGVNIEMLGVSFYAKMSVADYKSKLVPSFLGCDLPIIEGEFPNQNVIGWQQITWENFRVDAGREFSPNNLLVMFPLDSPACLKGSEYAALAGADYSYLTLLTADEFTDLRADWRPSPPMP